MQTHEELSAMDCILSAARQQGFEITGSSDFRLEGRRGEYLLQFQRSFHTPLAHLRVGREEGDTVICQAFFHEDLEKQVAARILALAL
jgi:hypothetical protein